MRHLSYDPNSGNYDLDLTPDEERAELIALLPLDRIDRYSGTTPPDLRVQPLRGLAGVFVAAVAGLASTIVHFWR